MKNIITLFVLLLMGMVLANEHCENQRPLGFEEATFMVGENVTSEHPQDVADSLLIQLEQNLNRIDSFTTPRTHYELFRVTATNELVLMTSSATHVCFYSVPTDEPVWKKIVIS